jgi:adenylate kinase family enzyme
MESFIGKRIMVIGSPGSGKSHFSAELSYRTGLPLFHLDRNAWSGDAGKWQPADAQRFVEWQTRTVEDDEWIFDGNYSGTMNLRLSRADTVFCFELPRLKCLFGYFRRLAAHALWPKADRADDPRERYDPRFIKYIWKFNQKELIERLCHTPELRVFIFRRRRDIDQFFSHLDLSLAREREARLKSAQTEQE